MQPRPMRPLSLAALMCGLAAGLRTESGSQLEAERKPKRHPSKKHTGGPEELVLIHVPYNFGHAVELAALLPSSMLPVARGGYNGQKDSMANKFTTQKITWAFINGLKWMKKDSEIWGHFNPDLNVNSEATGCPMYYTPPKYWPKDLAQKYFQNKTRFGMLRDPYERLNSFFRGGFDAYGGNYPEYFKTCDVNSAVKQMMKDLLKSGNMFKDTCTFIPQAEYFDGEFGINLPIDNRRFPSSLQKVFDDYGYNIHMDPDAIPHVRGCDTVWSGNFDHETKALVKKVYAKDFELLCKHFNYCDDEEEVCIPEVPYMCPLDQFKWDSEAKKYRKKLPGEPLDLRQRLPSKKERTEKL